MSDFQKLLVGKLNLAVFIYSNNLESQRIYFMSILDQVVN